MSQDEGVSRAFYEHHAEAWTELLCRMEEDVGAGLAELSIKASLRSRLKSLESLREKQARPAYDPAQGGADVKDLLALRVLVPFLQDIDRVVDMLGTKFSTLEVERKSEGLSFREFAYDAVHVIVDLGPLAKAVKLPPGLPEVCEIQVRTFLQDAWAEVEHELIYKSAAILPDHAVRKKLAALNANLMLADSMFQEIRDYQRDQARWGQARFNELKKKAAALSESSVDQLSGKEVDRSGDVGRTLPAMAPSAQLLTDAIRAHNAKQYHVAIEAYTRVLENEQEATTRSFAYNHRGMARFMIGADRDALKDFTAAVSSLPTNHNALNNRALAWRHLGVVHEALADFRRSLAIRAGQTEVHFLMAQTYVELESGEAQARACLAEALRLDPEYSEARALAARLEEKVQPGLEQN